MACKGAGQALRRRSSDETVQSTSMFRKISLALLAGASCVGAGLHQAAAIELTPPAEPTVIYADQPAQQPAEPARKIYPDPPNMGGGFIESLSAERPNG